MSVSTNRASGLLNSVSVSCKLKLTLAKKDIRLHQTEPLFEQKKAFVYVWNYSGGGGGWEGFPKRWITHRAYPPNVESFSFSPFLNTGTPWVSLAKTDIQGKVSIDPSNFCLSCVLCFCLLYMIVYQKIKFVKKYYKHKKNFW